MRPFIAAVAKATEAFVICYPNAGELLVNVIWYALAFTVVFTVVFLNDNHIPFVVILAGYSSFLGQ